VNITIELPKLPDIGSLQKPLSRTALLGVQIIKERTEKGVGYMGKFAPYVPSYAKRKAEGWPAGKVTRAFSGDPSGVVNLMVRGNMLGAMITEASGNSAKIMFSRREEAAKAAWNNRKRPFFGFNQAEAKRLATFFRKELMK
jgi:hypothetical protein